MSGAPLTIGAVLSLTGRFARFGTQAARGLRVWNAMTGGTEIRIEDDGGEQSRVEPALDALAGRCDLLLGPYSTVLMRSACTFAMESDRLVWNHGGSGDDVQASAPGHVVSVLTPTSRYAESFIRLLAHQHETPSVQFIAGRGSFGRQVISGARQTAHLLGIPAVEEGGTALFTAGSFEEDTSLVDSLLAERTPPQIIGTVAAGVQEFAQAVGNPEGIFGVAQWIPGRAETPDRCRYIGPDEPDFLAEYAHSSGSMPDYPAIQAVATAALATHCAREADSTAIRDLWAVATRLRAATLFGEFDVDPATGAQRGHQMALVRWRNGRMEPA